MMNDEWLTAMPNSRTVEQSNSPVRNAPGIADLHKIALALGWPKREVHQLLHDWCVRLWPEYGSLKDLSDEDRIVFAAQLRSSGGQKDLRVFREHPRRSRPSHPTAPGVVRLASDRQKQLIKTLASEMRWTASLLNGFLKTHFECETVDQIGTTARACKAIQMLKAYKLKKERKAVRPFGCSTVRSAQQSNSLTV